MMYVHHPNLCKRPEMHSIKYDVRVAVTAREHHPQPQTQQCSPVLCVCVLHSSLAFIHFIILNPYQDFYFFI